MKLKEFKFKLFGKLHKNLIISQRNKVWYFFLYKSFWHMLLKRKYETSLEGQYMTGRPNPGAGIGHQISNWISGYSYARYWKIKYAYIPFSYVSDPYIANDWDKFLGFYQDEIMMKDLVQKGYKVVLLPLFDENNEKHISIIKKIMYSYKKKCVFLLEMDQRFINDRLFEYNILKKFKSCEERKKNFFLYDNNKFNIAVHIRRGDIVQSGREVNENITMRWLDNDYYVAVLKNVMLEFDLNSTEIYIFSQGEKKDFKEFEIFENIHFCLDTPAIDTFDALINADLLIMSRSGFSYQASKLNDKAIYVYPYGFWHSPCKNDKRYWMADENGRIIKNIS